MPNYIDGAAERFLPDDYETADQLDGPQLSDTLELRSLSAHDAVDPTRFDQL
jgi:hypothetical protein